VPKLIAGFIHFTGNNMLCPLCQYWARTDGDFLDDEPDHHPECIFRTDAIKRLEKWKNSSKCHSCEIKIDNGYGATCWSVHLYGGAGSSGAVVDAYECPFVSGEYPKHIVFVCPENMDEWPGLAATIHTALNHWEKLYGLR
jgi:hypothetical protein